MTTPRGFRDRSDDSLFTLIGDIPELVRNLVVAEINGAKAWAQRTAKDAGIGAGWFVGALIVVFWAVPVFFAFVIAGLSSWWPVWLSALVVFGVMIVVTAILALLGYLRFKKLSKRENPGKAIAEDVRIVKEARDEY
ncbi:Flp pilus assembly protein TadB [Microbacterium testaceum]|uniref:phage holin family protein n=1 Tax=Microbacterium TaxID=33882 RepID=UPI001AE84C9F|nr:MULTISPECIES: phage holin family protein [Microbacterium]MDQ1112090.1 Flp pilus assembly protein TadB [Microbacterium testaceum]MDR6097375.1 Flp pilus assembly protein TadB [Microbacterium sp. SORGH_AS_0454]WAC69993.1 phage holin family protein [Microbacterium sp. SL75]